MKAVVNNTRNSPRSSCLVSMVYFLGACAFTWLCLAPLGCEGGKKKVNGGENLLEQVRKNVIPLNSSDTYFRKEGETIGSIAIDSSGKLVVHGDTMAVMKQMFLTLRRPPTVVISGKDTARYYSGDTIRVPMWTLPPSEKNVMTDSGLILNPSFLIIDSAFTDTIH